MGDEHSDYGGRLLGLATALEVAADIHSMLKIATDTNTTNLLAQSADHIDPPQPPEPKYRAYQFWEWAEQIHKRGPIVTNRKHHWTAGVDQIILDGFIKINGCYLSQHDQVKELAWPDTGEPCGVRIESEARDE